MNREKYRDHNDANEEGDLVVLVLGLRVAGSQLKSGVQDGHRQHDRHNTVALGDLAVVARVDGGQSQHKYFDADSHLVDAKQLLIELLAHVPVSVEEGAGAVTKNRRNALSHLDFAVFHRQPRVYVA